MKRRRQQAVRPSKEQIQSATFIAIRKIDAWETLGRYFLVVSGVVGLAYFGIYMPIEASAGKDTAISYVVNFISDVKLDVVLAWGSAAGASAWAIRERRAKMSERKEKDKRIADLEKHIDSRRTSSGLDVGGDKHLEGRA